MFFVRTLLCLSETSILTETKPMKTNSGPVGKGVHLRKDVALASANPNTQIPVNHPLGPRGHIAAAVAGASRGHCCGGGPP